MARRKRKTSARVVAGLPVIRRHGRRPRTGVRGRSRRTSRRPPPHRRYARHHAARRHDHQGHARRGAGLPGAVHHRPLRCHPLHAADAVARRRWTRRSNRHAGRCPPPRRRGTGRARRPRQPGRFSASGTSSGCSARSASGRCGRAGAAGRCASSRRRGSWWRRWGCWRGIMAMLGPRCIFSGRIRQCNHQRQGGRGYRMPSSVTGPDAGRGGSSLGRSGFTGGLASNEV